ncbi:SH3 domain-containing protein [Actinomycetes bacterium NPDC127524]
MNILRFIIILTLAFSAMLYKTTNSEASSTYSSTVIVTNLSVRDKPGITSKKIGSLPKGSIINIYSVSKTGWSETWFKGKKAFVTTKYVKKLYQKISFKRDKSKVYSYITQGRTSKEKYIGNLYGVDIWESKEGQVDGEAVLNIQYPLVVGSSWLSYDTKNVITSISKTIITPAGTFKNVVVIKEDNYSYYYARNVGFIKAVENGKIISQLNKISKK